MLLTKSQILSVYVDGGARGNPGPAAVGLLATDEKNNNIFSVGKKIGFATNNQAEYTAVVEGLRCVLQKKNKLSGLSRVEFFLDSQLVVMQLRGLYKVKNPWLKDLLFKVRQLEIEVGLPVAYNHIPREKNRKADRLVNLALDNKISLSYNDQDKRF